MFEYLDVLLAVALFVLLCFLLWKMYSFDRHMEDLRENGQFAPIIFTHDTRWRRRERDRRSRKKYGLIGCIMLVLVMYSVLRINGTIGSIF